jgi:hypothetical protein
MKNILATLLVTILFCTTFTACKKYPEGPNFSFRSVKQRITNTWKIESININGLEVVNQPKYSSQKQFWLADGSYNQTFIDPNTGIGLRQDGRWELLDNNNKVTVTINNLVSNKPESAITYSILKLYNNCLWLRSADNSQEIHLVTAE